MKILVTGGAGFIGSHIVESCLSKGYKVVAIDNLSTGKIENITPFQKNPLFEFIKADVVTYEDLHELVKVDCIFHMAAVLGLYRVIAEPLELLRTNMLGTEKLLEAVKPLKSKPRILLASTSSVYGRMPANKGASSEDDVLYVGPPHIDYLAGYAISKLTDEALACAHHKAYQYPITSIRFFNTVGPRQTGLYGMVVPRFVKQAMAGEPITVFGDGTQTRSFCDVRDSIQMLHAIAEKNICIGEPINVGNDKEISINDLAALVLKCANSKSIITHIPYAEAYGVDFTDIAQRKPNLSKLRELIGYGHKWDLEKTIHNLIELNKKQEK